MNRIPDKMLAYLNENLDLVTEYMHTHSIKYGATFPLAYCVFEVVRSCIHDDMYVTITASHANQPLIRSYAYNWRDMVEYVEDNDDAPPVLK